MLFETGAGLTLTISLTALAANWKRPAALSAPAECAAVVKADACGIGIDAAVPDTRRHHCPSGPFFLTRMSNSGSAGRRYRQGQGTVRRPRVLP